MLDLCLNFIKKIKRKLFPFYKSKELKFVFKTLQGDISQDTVVARFVGGCVRKYLSNEAIDDIDVATILTTDEVRERFINTNFKVKWKDLIEEIIYFIYFKDHLNKHFFKFHDLVIVFSLA